MKQKKQGFFMVEILLSLVVLSILFVSIFSTISFLERRTTRSRYDAQASSLVTDATEIAHDVLLTKWNETPDGVYSPVFDADANTWILDNGEEENVAARFTRKVEIMTVCRALTGGTISEVRTGGNCSSGKKDPSSKMVQTTLSWVEGETDKSIVAKLLVFNSNI